MTLETLLATDEHVLIDGRQHPVALVKFALQPILILGLALLLFVIGLWFNPDGILGFIDTLLGWATIITFLIGIIWLPIQAVRWTQRRYVLTDRRTLRLEGLVNKRSYERALEKINDVQFRQGFFGRQFGYGDLEISTASNEGTEEFPMLRDALAYKKAMEDAKNSALARGMTAFAGGVAPPVPGAASQAPADSAATQAEMTPDDVTSTLASLADLRDRGAITPEEYDAKKAELLERL